MNPSLTAATAWARHRGDSDEEDDHDDADDDGDDAGDGDPWSFRGVRRAARVLRQRQRRWRNQQHRRHHRDLEAPGLGQPYDSTSWVSYANTSSRARPATATPNGQVVSFYDSTFLPSATDVTGWLRVMADDSASIYLNNTLLLPEASQIGNAYATCSDKPIRLPRFDGGGTGASRRCRGQGNNNLLFHVTEGNSSSARLELASMK